MAGEARIGADEAGKGPVLGPMVAAAVRAPPGSLPDGVDDSKRLSADRRADLAARIRDRGTVAVETVGVDRIDDPSTDMTGLAVAAQAAAVAAVAAPGDRVLADAADVDPDRFGRRVADAVGVPVDVVAEHGADAAHASVGAASVVAKVERDRRMAAIAGEYDRAVGSGYPSDPTTREFLREYVREHGRLPDCARTTWRTCDDLLAAAEQSALSEF
ncbi:MAG: ribonuclease HII [Haloferacaceae archaeon]